MRTTIECKLQSIAVYNRESTVVESTFAREARNFSDLVRYIIISLLISVSPRAQVGVFEHGLGLAWFDMVWFG